MYKKYWSCKQKGEYEEFFIMQNIPSEVQKVFNATINILDTNYGANRKLSDDGGYIILLLIDNDTNVKDIYDKILKDNHIQKDWCEFHDTICTHNGKIYYSDLFIIGSEYSVTIIWNELKEQN